MKEIFPTVEESLVYITLSNIEEDSIFTDACKKLDRAQMRNLFEKNYHEENRSKWTRPQQL